MLTQSAFVIPANAAEPSPKAGLYIMIKSKTATPPITSTIPKTEVRQLFSSFEINMITLALCAINTACRKLDEESLPVGQPLKRGNFSRVLFYADAD